MGYFVKNRKLKSGSTNVVVPTGSSAERPLSAVFGGFRYNTDIAALEFFNGAVWSQVNVAGETNMKVDSFVGDGSTTTFAISETVQSAQKIIVFVGAIYQNPNTYDITGLGNNITFVSAPPPNEVINVIHNLANNQPA